MSNKPLFLIGDIVLFLASAICFLTLLNQALLDQSGKWNERIVFWCAFGSILGGIFSGFVLAYIVTL